MSNEVQFDFDEEQRPEYNRSGSKLSKLVVKLSGGLVKDETQANYVLIGLVALALFVSFFLFFDSSSSNEMLLEQQKLLYPPGSSALR